MTLVGGRTNDALVKQIRELGGRSVLQLSRTGTDLGKPIAAGSLLFATVEELRTTLRILRGL